MSKEDQLKKIQKVLGNTSKTSPRMTRGRYKGEFLHDIAETNAGYLLWALREWTYTEYTFLILDWIEENKEWLRYLEKSQK